MKFSLLVCLTTGLAAMAAPKADAAGPLERRVALPEPISGPAMDILETPKLRAKSFGKRHHHHAMPHHPPPRGGHRHGGGNAGSKSTSAQASQTTDASGSASSSNAVLVAQTSTAADASSSADATSTADASSSTADATSTANDSSSTADATSTSSAADATSSSGSGGSNNDNILNPSVIQTGLEQDGTDPNSLGFAQGEVASLTSDDNFINFCVGQTLTNGKQIKTGSCNPTPMGFILSTDKMPSAKFQFPQNFGSVTANQNFTVKLQVNNLKLGFFTNAQLNYYAAPAQLDGQGFLKGHTHVTIQQIDSFDSATVLDSSQFVFFKGINDAGDGNGLVSTTVAGGLKPGFYRMGSINTAMNHQPALVAVAQHGMLDDVIYFQAQ